MYPVPEVAAAPAWRRILAWVLDLVIVGVVAGVLLVMAYYVAGLRSSGIAGQAGHLGLTLTYEAVRPGGGGVGETVGGAVADQWDYVALPYVLALAALPVLHFLYLVAAVRLTGRTFGKAAFDLRVLSGGARPSLGASVRRAAVTATAESGIFCLACVLLLRLEAGLSVLVWLAAVVAFWAYALPALGSGQRNLADRAAGTSVVPGQTFQRVAALTADGGRYAVAFGQEGLDRIRDTRRPPRYPPL
ncbi:RDD family protein [Actinocorallia longicatena]|uniref:RDD domain-containing protein n=1 Tax=Actinocorallia longicatena TaxID=111803 RepID=A0ABP6Q3B4_9ACTN